MQTLGAARVLSPATDVAIQGLEIRGGVAIRGSVPVIGMIIVNDRPATGGEIAIPSGVLFH